MKLYRTLEEVPADFGPSALTIGNFDGVHTGHRRILGRLRARAAADGLRPSALTFHPHPTAVVAPRRAPRLMTTPEQRAELMRAEGIEQTVILPFTAEVARLEPEEFCVRVLAERLGVRAVLVGANFRFGRGQAGDVAALREMGGRLGFATEVVPAVEWRGRVVSSSAIRALLAAGDVARAARMLGRPHALEGDVVRGRGVGSKQTVPTLNLATACEAVPAPGVYITRTRDLAGPRQWRSITNVGYRPTFGESEDLSIESFLLGAVGQAGRPVLPDLEGAAPCRIAVDFMRRVRGERRFDSPGQLKEQILRDAGRAEAWWRRVRAWTGG